MPVKKLKYSQGSTYQQHVKIFS